MDWRGVELGPLPEPSRGPFKEALVTLRVSVAMEVIANDAWPDNIRLHLRCEYHDKSDSISYFLSRFWLLVRLINCCSCGGVRR